MRHEESFSDLQKMLQSTTPPPTAVPRAFRQQLRHTLLTQATAASPRLPVRRLALALVALVLFVGVMGSWWAQTQPRFEPVAQPTSIQFPLISQETAMEYAFAYGYRENNKPIGGRITGEPLGGFALWEPYDTALSRLGQYAIATHRGSNIIHAEHHGEAVWFVHMRVPWQPFGQNNRTVRYFAALIHPQTGQVVAAGSSTVIMVEGPLTLALDDYPPQASPYLVEGYGFWLVNTGDQLWAFDPRSPYHPDSRFMDYPGRCLYTWSPDQGRFLDPCSGDEWELDGTLNLTESTEMWSNRDLDQYRVVIEGGSILVYPHDVTEGAKREK